MTLSIDRIVDVTVTLQPLSAQVRDFGASLIIGSSPVIPLNERIRLYNSIGDVGADFGVNQAEYQAAALFFNQSPQPSELRIGRWVEAAAAGQLLGAPLTVAQQALSNFTAITAGALTLNIDGAAVNLTNVNLSGAANLNAVAGILTTALTTHGTAVWNAALGQFVITSSTTGASSSVAASTDTPLGAALKVRATDNPTSVAGAAAESALAAVQALANVSADWYSAAFADTSLVAADHVAIAGYIEAASPARLYGYTTQDPQELVPGQTTTVGYQLKQLAYNHTFGQYSSTQPYAVVSILGRMSTVDFTGSNTTITLKFKNEPGIVAENLSATQANALEGNNVNVFAAYNNSTSILEQGVVASGNFIDEIHGLAWLQNDVQTAVYNEMRNSPKVPQTDAGVNQLVNAVNASCARGVTNGLIAPGQWNLPGFGKLNEGDYLTNGYYTYAPPISSQSQSDRDARKAPPIQCAVKLAGAIHSATVNINVNK